MGKKPTALSQSHALEQQLRNALGHSLFLLPELVVQSCDILRGDQSRLVLLAKLFDDVDMNSPAFAGSVYSLLVHAGFGFTSAWVKQYENPEARISIRSASVAHVRPPRTQSLIIEFQFISRS